MARWYAMSTQFLSDPKVERLGEKHGPAAVSVLVALFGQAMLQENGGTVERTYRTLANDSFIDRDLAAEIIADAAEVGLLNIEERDEIGATVYFPAWSRHQATYRKAKSREARKATDRANVTGSHGESRPVTESHSQDKTGEEKTGQELKKKRSTPDPDSLPEDFPAELTPPLQAVTPILERVAAAKSAKPIHRLPLAKTLVAYPDRDHAQVADELEFWCLHGNGEKKNQRDIIATYRNFLKRADAIAPRSEPIPTTDYDAKAEVVNV